MEGSAHYGKTPQLLKKMENDNTSRGFTTAAKTYHQKMNDIQLHVDKLKEVLYASQKLI